MRGPLATATAYRSPPPSRSVTPVTQRSPMGETDRGPEPGRRSPHNLVDTPESNPLGYGEGSIIPPRGATDPHGIESRHAIGIDRIMWSSTLNGS